MRINASPNLGKNSIQFGYNKKFHKKVRNYLEGQAKSNPKAGYLMDLEKLSLRIEDNLVKMEKRNQTNTEEYDDCAFCLSELKNHEVFFMEDWFPELKYCDKVINQYIEEGKSAQTQPAQDWREVMCKQLSGYSAKWGQVFKSPASVGNQSSKDLIQKTVDILNGQNTKTSENDFQIAQEEYDQSQKALAEVLKYVTQFEITPASPKGFQDVSGMDDIKERLKTELIDYVNNPELLEQDFIEYQIRPPRGYLFYGPPGCGKTFMTQAIGYESKLPAFKMDISKIGTKWINETSNNIQKTFDGLAKYSSLIHKPVILFLDEADSLVMRRTENENSENTKATTTLLKCTESARDKGIIVIAATNKVDMLDDAFKSRLDGQFFFSLPTSEQIEKLLKQSLSSRKKGEKLAKDKIAISNLAKMLEGHSNRSIVFIIDEASKLAKRNNRSDITFEDVKKAIETTEYEKSDEKSFKKQNKMKLGFTV
ncbi:ATP-binding protein [bacterium]|nr:ATP-binding protein [bacterium]